MLNTGEGMTLCLPEIHHALESSRRCTRVKRVADLDEEAIRHQRVETTPGRMLLVKSCRRTRSCRSN